MCLKATPPGATSLFKDLIFEISHLRTELEIRSLAGILWCASRAHFVLPYKAPRDPCHLGLLTPLFPLLECITNFLHIPFSFLYFQIVLYFLKNWDSSHYSWACTVSRLGANKIASGFHWSALSECALTKANNVKTKLFVFLGISNIQIILPELASWAEFSPLKFGII